MAGNNGRYIRYTCQLPLIFCLVLTVWIYIYSNIINIIMIIIISWTLYSARIHQILVLKAHYIITPIHQVHKSFLKPSQLPNQTQQPTTALTGTHLLLGGEKQLWWSVSLKGTSTTVAVGIRTHIPTTRSSEHKYDALNRSAMTLHVHVCPYHMGVLNQLLKLQVTE